MTIHTPNYTLDFFNEQIFLKRILRPWTNIVKQSEQQLNEYS
uniref:Uncharacterized protein n=1 Tax=Arundo donax TaxID=35708 RepID=A0A0A8ZD93_ARUDO